MKNIVLFLVTFLSFANVHAAEEFEGSMPEPQEAVESLSELRQRLPEGWQSAQRLLIEIDKKTKNIYVSMQNNNGKKALIPGYIFQTENIVYPDTKPKGSPIALALSPNGRYLFVADPVFRDVSTFLISDDGSLVRINKPAKIRNFRPFRLTMSPDKRHLFVTNQQNTHRKVFFINDDGSLSMPVSYLPCFSCQKKTKQITSLSAPLPRRWLELQVIALSSALREGQREHEHKETLPESLEQEIAQMVLGEEIKFTDEIKLERKAVEGGVSSLSFKQLIDYLLYHFDKHLVIGGEFKRFASRFLSVKRGTLTPAGFKALKEWVKDKGSKELDVHLKTIQRKLQNSNLSPHRTGTLKAIHDRLYFYINKKK